MTDTERPPPPAGSVGSDSAAPALRDRRRPAVASLATAVGVVLMAARAQALLRALSGAQRVDRWREAQRTNRSPPADPGKGTKIGP
jgi:hypothetical protein